MSSFPLSFEFKGRSRLGHLGMALGMIIGGAAATVLTALLIYGIWESGWVVFPTIFLLLFCIGLFFRGWWMLLESVFRASYQVQCVYCGNMQSVLSKFKQMRCAACGKMLWSPRNQSEQVVLATCSVCSVPNALPAAGGEPMPCPNCGSQLHIPGADQVCLAEPEVPCPSCGATLGASAWFCPRCGRVIGPHVLAELDEKTAPAFLNGLSVTAATAAADGLTELVRQELISAGPFAKMKKLKDCMLRQEAFNRLIQAAYGLLHAQTVDGELSKQDVGPRLGAVDVLFGFVLLRTAHDTGAVIGKTTRPARDESYKTQLRIRLIQFAQVRHAAEAGRFPIPKGPEAKAWEDSSWHVKEPFAGKKSRRPMLLRAATLAGAAETAALESASEEQILTAMRTRFSQLIQG